MKNALLIPILCFIHTGVFSQKDSMALAKIKAVDDTGVIPKEDFERPFNFFAAAGGAYRFGNLYNVVVSPVDYTVQFEDVFPVHTRFSMGLVWNPFPDKSKENLEEFKKHLLMERAYKAARRHAAVALLVNIAQLSFSSGEVNATSPIDVGLGVGYRNDNFLILGTLEMTPFRNPRNYFTETFKDKNKQLILPGTMEPVRNLSIDDGSIFIDRVFISIGIKIAYAFSGTKK